MASTTYTSMAEPPIESSSGTIKFPTFHHDPLPDIDEAAEHSPAPSPKPGPFPFMNGHASDGRWPTARKDSPYGGWGNGSMKGVGAGMHHGRQKSLSEAIRTIRTRRGSVSQNAVEIADALKAPVSPNVILYCAVWYLASILSNTSSKTILTALPQPVTLSLVQFMFVSSYCLFFAWLARMFPALRNRVPALKNGIRRPTKELILTTLPLTCFQIGGHILTSDAMTRIPVSLVHTIKGLSPLFTVFAYKIFFHINYSILTYLSLIPLTLGVAMACSADITANFLGLLSAFGSTISFVTQNIVSKKLFNEAALAELDGTRTRKPDKLNLLCYSSGLAFLITAPIWIYAEGFALALDFVRNGYVALASKPGTIDHGRLALEFFFNGTTHFGQNLVAFALLAMVSPVTYSVASLIKRVFVICFAIVWFGNTVSTVQAVGIGLTFAGLYLYDRTSDANKADRRAKALAAKNSAPLLPLQTKNLAPDQGSAVFTESPATMRRSSRDEKRNDDFVPHHGRPRGHSGAGWLPPGTRQEETWNLGDAQEQSSRQQQGHHVVSVI